MTWSIWLPRGCSHCLLFSVHRERYLQLIYFLLVSLPEWFASTMAESAGPLRRMVSGQRQKVLSRRWVAPFSRISKKALRNGRGNEHLLCHCFLYRGFLEIPCRASRVTELHMTWRYPYSRLERWINEDLDPPVQAVVSPRAPASPIRGVGGQLPPLGASGQCGGFQK